MLRATFGRERGVFSARSHAATDAYIAGMLQEASLTPRVAVGSHHGGASLAPQPTADGLCGFPGWGGGAAAAAAQAQVGWRACG